MAVISDRQCNFTPAESVCVRACSHPYVCLREFMCHRGLDRSDRLQNLESGLRVSLHVGPDLPVSDTDSSSPPASLSRLPGEGLTPYCQCRRLNGDLFYNPPSPSRLHLPLSVVRLHIPARVSALSSLPPFLHSLTPPIVTADTGLSNVPAAAGSSIIKRLRRIEIISIRALR